MRTSFERPIAFLVQLRYRNRLDTMTLLLHLIFLELRHHGGLLF